MEENKNLKKEETDTTVTEESLKEEEPDNLEQMREQAKKTSEKKKKAKKQRDSKKRLHIAGIVAGIAGVLELLSGIMSGNTTTLCLGILFIVIGYFYYHLDRKF